MALGIEDIENVLGKGLPLIILRNEALCAVKSCKNLESLSDEYV